MLISLDQAEELIRADGDSADALSNYLRAALIESSKQSSAEPSGKAAMIALTVRSDTFSELQKSVRFEGLSARCADIRPIPIYRCFLLQRPLQRKKEARAKECCAHPTSTSFV